MFLFSVFLIFSFVDVLTDFCSIMLRNFENSEGGKEGGGSSSSTRLRYPFKQEQIEDVLNWSLANDTPLVDEYVKSSSYMLVVLVV